MKTKRKNKIILFGLLAMVCIITPMLAQGKSTKLVFEGETVLSFFQPLEMWMEDDVMHFKFYKEATAYGAIDDIEFTGHLELYFYLKIFPSGDWVGHGTVTYYIDLNGMSGYFYGIANGKKVAGVMDVKITLQGFGDYIGWKLFAAEWGIDDVTNGQIGTVLIPN
ncbi:MAG: hypothetical protein GPJ50_13085 [Candidatus Heimdallarchaeota archaeon]|nr:hypothetical protein [Candidatus Heimdallarchaeota archaeon]